MDVVRVLRVRKGALAGLVLALASPFVLAQPAWDKAFDPAVIGPGSAARLVFTIDNSASATPATELAFTDNLPAGVTLADAVQASSSCGGTLDAPAGGSAITFSGGALTAGASCTISVMVTATTVATHTNTSGDLTSSGGNSGVATADLEVVATRPGFSKAFAPATVTLGARTRLEFTLDNTANTNSHFNLGFSDTLPVGLEIADPAAPSSDCPAFALTATPGSSIVTLPVSFGPLSAEASCTLGVDVVANAGGRLENVSGQLTSTPGGPSVSSGFAAASLQVDVAEVALIKTFVDDPVPAGGVARLRFELRNFSRTEAASGLAFSDDLDATLTGLVATGLPLADPCGAGSLLSGTSALAFTGGSLPPEGSCVFEVELAVPAAATPGDYPNTTSNLTGDLGGVPLVSPPAGDTLFVSNAPILGKEFIDDPASAGGSATLRFTLLNPGTTTASAITFTDELTTFLGFPVSATLPPPDPCGAGSSVTLVSLGTDRQGLLLNNGSLAAAASCSFDVVLNLPIGQPPGVYQNVTTEVTAIVDGEPATGAAARDELVVVAAPRLLKEFPDGAADPGATTTLRFTLILSENAPEPVTAVAFSDDLAAMLSGATALGLPLVDPCGAGSTLSGTSSLSLTGASLSPGEQCSFDVTVQVPAGATSGTYTNTTSTVAGSSGGTSVQSSAATADLQVGGLEFSKSFIDDPVVPGGQVTLRFSIDNPTSAAATAIFFSDDVGAALAGLVVVAPLPVEPCGAGSTLLGTTTLILSSGNLAAGTGCSFDVTLQVPVGAAVGQYGNLTSNLTAELDGNPLVFPPAADGLEVSVPLIASKVFADDPVAPGATVTLQFTLDNQSASDAATGISFTDDLDAVLSGLAALDTPLADPCGAGSMLSGTSLLTLTGATVAAGASCSFSVTLQVPAGAAAGTYANTTSDVVATIGSVAVTTSPATDELSVASVSLSKAFAGPGASGGTVDLEFTLDNRDITTGVSQLAFTDDLDAVLPGLVATGLPLVDVCGAGSSISGSSLLTFTSGSLGPGESCSFVVTLQVPVLEVAGAFPNVTSALFAGGIEVGEPATDDLMIEPPPSFAKGFTPDSIGVGQTSTLAFIIDNSASAIAASALTFTDSLPAGMTVANSPGVANTCGGTVTASAGSTSIALAGGSVGAGAVCTLSVDVVGTAPGALINTSSDLASSSGSVGGVSATLQVFPQPGFAKAFAPAVVAVGGTSTLAFTIDNSANGFALTALSFVDTLPAGLEVAATPNAASSCTGGTLTAVAGSGSVSYTGGGVPASSSCTLSVDVTATVAGDLLNTSSTLSSSLGQAAPASATLSAVDTDLVIAKAWLSTPVLRGGQVQLEYTLSNPTAEPATDLAFSDDLDAALAGLAAPGTPLADPCGAGSTLSGTSVLSLAGGSLAAGASCTITVVVQVPAAAAVGSYPGSTSAVTGTIAAGAVTGNSASATLDVAFLAFTKTFGGAVERGEAGTLGFTLSNPDPVNAVTGIGFSDDLEAVLPGLVATGLPQNDLCGAGSSVSGSSVVMLADGSLAAGGSCSFSIDIEVPEDASAGDYGNVTSPLLATVAGNPVSGAPADVASSTLTVLPGGGPTPLPSPTVVPVDSRGLLVALVLLLGLAGGLGLRMRRG